MAAAKCMQLQNRLLKTEIIMCLPLTKKKRKESENHMHKSTHTFFNSTGGNLEVVTVTWRWTEREFSLVCDVIQLKATQHSTSFSLFVCSASCCIGGHVDFCVSLRKQVLTKGSQLQNWGFTGWHYNQRQGIWFLPFLSWTLHKINLG